MTRNKIEDLENIYDPNNTVEDQTGHVNDSKPETHPALEPPSALDWQIGGGHYKKFKKLQPYEAKAKMFNDDELWGFTKGSVMDYMLRDKGSRRENINKAIHHLQLYLELCSEEIK